jgi:hypothetical protein
MIGFLRSVFSPTSFNLVDSVLFDLWRDFLITFVIRRSHINFAIHSVALVNTGGNLVATSDIVAKGCFPMSRLQLFSRIGDTFEKRFG